MKALPKRKGNLREVLRLHLIGHASMKALPNRKGNSLARNAAAPLSWPQ